MKIWRCYFIDFRNKPETAVVQMHREIEDIDIWQWNMNRVQHLYLIRHLKTLKFEDKVLTPIPWINSRHLSRR